MKKAACSLFVILLVLIWAGDGLAYTINWSCSPSFGQPSRLFKNNGEDPGTIAIDGSTSSGAPPTWDSSAGGFLQLIFIGADNTFNSESHSTWDTLTGLDSASDDQVVDSFFVGGNIFALIDPNPDGRFGVKEATTTVSDGGVAANTQFVIRFFEMGSLDGSAVPTAGHYGYAYADGSKTYFTPTAVGGSDVNTFSIVNNFTASMGPIPEPGTLALFGLGLVTLAVRSRLRRS